jgi:WD40 repeat protein
MFIVGQCQKSWVICTVMLCGALSGASLVLAEPRQTSKAASTDNERVAGPADPEATKRPKLDSLGDPLPDGALLRLGTSRFHPPGGASDLALSPDESVIVSLGKQLIAWDTANGKELWRASAEEFGVTYHGASYGVRGLAFAADGSHFYTPGPGKSVMVWEVATGKCEMFTINVQSKAGPNLRNAGPRSLDVTTDGQKFALGDLDGVVVCDNAGEVLFQIANKAQGPLKFNDKDRLTFSGHNSYCRFSPDGTLLAVVTSDLPEQLGLFDTETGKELRRIKLTSRLVRLAFSPDGKQVVATERDSAVRAYEVDSGQRVWSRVLELKNPYENYTSAVAYSPDGKIIAAGATDNQLHLFDAATGEPAGVLTGHGWYPWTLAFAGNSQLLYSSGWDGALRRWDVPARKQLPLPSGTRASGTVTASPDGRWLAYVDDSAVIHLVDSQTGTEARTIQLPGAAFSHLCFSPDGQRVAGGGSHGDQVHVAVWNVADGRLLHRWDWPKGRDPHSIAESLCFSPDGTRLAANVFRQSTAFVWDLTSGEQLHKFDHQEVYGVAFSPNGETLASAGWDSTVRFWDTKTGALRRKATLPDDQGRNGDLRMYAVCYASEGGLLATAHLDGKVRVWQADTLKLRAEFHVSGRFIYGAISFSPDGLWLATGSASGQVELWDPQTGMRVREVGKHQGYVYTVGFGRDNKTVVTGGSQESLCYLWDLRPTEDRPRVKAAELWNDIAGDAGTEAFEAMWGLADLDDQAVSLITEKLRRVTAVVDPDYDTDGLADQDRDRITRLQERLANGDATVERAITVRRAVSLLEQIGSPAAEQLLEDLAQRDATGDLGRIVRGALNRHRR